MNDELQQPEKAQLAQLKLERFVQRFEPAHRDLALHASLPLILTPELVNHLRAEFLLDSVGWVAEADLLLSDLCREIGYEMYLMDRDVRALLREALQRDERFGPERMRQIARRVYDYLAYLAETDPILRPEDLQSQRWTAMFYLDDATRREAAAEMVEAINRCLEMSPAELAASGGAVNWAELARFAHLIRQMTEQLRGDYDDLIEYAALARQVAAARLGEIPLSQLQPGELAREFEVAGKKLARLDWLIGEIERERARNQPKPKARVATGSLLVGEVVVATVEKADFLCVIVNLGSGAQGVAPVTDFLANDGSIAAKQGDSADVIITDPPDDGSRFGVSRVAALRPQDWAGIASAHKRGQCVVGRLTDLTKHGGQVEIAGFRAFLPIKEFDYSRARYSKSSEQRYFKSREQWIGKEIAVRITECDRAGYHLRVSRLAALNTEAELRRERTLAGLEESVVVEGRVKRLLDYGAFVDLGGFDGLLHKSEMSWARFDHPRELFREDERIAVKVLDVDRERKRVSLSRRQLLPDPWETAPERYSIGDRVAGAVVHLADFGAFVELEPGVEALVHASDISRERRIKHPGEALKKGQQIEAVIVSLNVEKRKIGLSIKDLTQPSTQPEIVRTR